MDTTYNASNDSRLFQNDFTGSSEHFVQFWHRSNYHWACKRQLLLPRPATSIKFDPESHSGVDVRILSADGSVTNVKMAFDYSTTLTPFGRGEDRVASQIFEGQVIGERCH